MFEIWQTLNFSSLYNFTYPYRSTFSNLPDLVLQQSKVSLVTTQSPNSVKQKTKKSSGDWACFFHPLSVVLVHLHHPDNSKEPPLLLLAPLILKQVLGELELLDLHGQAEVTGVHLQPGGEGGADDRDTDAALDSGTGT